MAAEVPDGPIILGVWTWFRPGTARGGAYVDSLIATLAAWAEDVRAGHVVVAGDFNTGTALGRGSIDANFGRDWRAWDELGLVSAYHHHFDEALDEPSRATHYFLSHEDRPFHIDFVLVPRAKAAAIRRVEVGGYEDWCAPAAPARSDHVPVIVDLSW